MKELTIEQKAKRYDEAIDVCRKLYNDAKANGYTSDIEDYEQIFPELAESEDEMIRKDLLYWLYAYKDGNETFVPAGDVDVWISYLEKQGEQKSADKVEPKCKVDLGNIYIEQNNTWSEEDKNRFTNLISLVKCSDENNATKAGFIEFINKLKSLKDIA